MTEETRRAKTEPLPVFRSMLRQPSNVLPEPHGRHTPSSLADTRPLQVIR
jgi:hypothetical protein